MNELRSTDTNSSDDSRGVTWGLEGNLLWVVITGAVLSIAAFWVIYCLLRASWVVAGLAAGLPFILSVLYAILRQTHPPGWDVDILDHWINGRGFSPRHLSVPSRGDGPDRVSSSH